MEHESDRDRHEKFMADSRRRREKWEEKARKLDMWVLITGMVGMWLCGVFYGLLFARFLLTYGQQAGLP